MDLQELLLKTMEENKVVQNDFIEVVEEEIEMSIDVPEDKDKFQKIVLEYMSSHGIPLSQTDYDQVAKLLSKNQDGEFHEVMKKKKYINILEEYSLEELKDVLQICILKQCERLCELIEADKKAEYEYVIERIVDSNGATNVRLMAETINLRAGQGWRVKNIFTNELGHNVSTVGIGGVSGGINSTADEVIIVFEKRK